MEFDDVNLLLILLQTYYNSILNLLGGPVMVPCWLRDGRGGVSTVQAYPQPLPEGKGVNNSLLISHQSITNLLQTYYSSILKLLGGNDVVTVELSQRKPTPAPP